MRVNSSSRNDERIGGRVTDTPFASAGSGSWRDLDVSQDGRNGVSTLEIASTGKGKMAKWQRDNEQHRATLTR